MGIQTHAIWGQAEGAGLGDSEEVKALGEANRSPLVPRGRLLRRWSQALHSNAWWEDGDNKHKLKEKRFVLVISEKPFPHEGSQAVEQVVQRCCAASVPRGFQDTTA